MLTTLPTPCHATPTISMPHLQVYCRTAAQVHRDARGHQWCGAQARPGGLLPAQAPGRCSRLGRPHALQPVDGRPDHLIPELVVMTSLNQSLIR